MTFMVREAVADDLEELYRLWQERADYYLRHDRRFKLSAESGSAWRVNVLNWLEREDSTVMVAAREGELIGYMVGWVWQEPPLFEQYGLVSEMSVDGHCKQGGVGTALLAELKNWFQSHSLSNVEIRVPHLHPIEQAFWRAMGAQPYIDHLYFKLE